MTQKPEGPLPETFYKWMIFFILLAILILCGVMAPSASAQTTESLTSTSGTCTISRYNMPAGQIDMISLDWTSDSGGNVVSTVPFRGEILRVVTNPDDGATSPTDQYDVVLEDQDSLDVLASGGADRSNSSSEHFAPLVSTYREIAVLGSLSLKVTNAGNANGGIIRIYFRQ